MSKQQAEIAALKTKLNHAQATITTQQVRLEEAHIEATRLKEEEIVRAFI